MDFHVENGKVFSNMSSIKYINVDTKLLSHFTEIGLCNDSEAEPTFVRSHKRHRALHGHCA